jgi:RNA polymerase sigma-70 factor (sigma-E family)
MTEFDQFVALHVEELLRTAYLIAWDEREAEDLVQECLFKVARRWPRVQAMEQPRAYARRILVNLAIDGARGRARRRTELDIATNAPPAGRDQSIPGLADPADALADRADLLQALAGLPRQQRAVLVLRYFNDLSEAQAAAVLGCSQGTVKSSASRGLARLRESLAPVPVQPGSTEA